MDIFAERLREIRTERGLTQGQLASMVKVSRQTVSHWEHGRVKPGAEMTELISAALGYDFLADRPMEAPAEADDAAPAGPADGGAPEDIPAEKRSAPSRRRVVVIIAAVLAVLATAVLTVILLCGKGKDRNSDAAHMAIIPAEENVYATVNTEYAGGIAWEFAFEITYTGTGPFTVTSMEERYRVMGTDEVITNPYDGNQIAYLFGSRELKPGGSYNWNGGMPRQNLAGLTLVVRGTDENGEEHEFSGSLTFRQEVKGGLGGVTGIVSRPSVTIVPAEAVVHAVDDPMFGSGNGWVYDYTITNNGISDIRITGIDEIFTRTDGSTSVEPMSDETIISLFGSDMIYIGQMVDMHGALNAQDVCLHTLIIRGIDNTGTEWEFTGSVVLLR